MASNIIHKLSQGLPSGPAPSAGIPAVKARAEAERRAWSGLSETSPAALPLLSRYWRTAGLSPSEWTPAGTPWSAAFVSELLHPYGLPPATAHFQYVQSVIDGDAPGWTAYRIDGPVQLAPGDVIVKPRGAGSPTDDAYWWSHGDVIYDVSGGRAYWVGGNVGDTLKSGSFLQAGEGDGADLDGAYVIILRPPQKKSVNPLLIVCALLLGVAVFRR